MLQIILIYFPIFAFNLSKLTFKVFFIYSVWLSALQAIVLCLSIAGPVNCNPRIWIAHQLNYIVLACYFTTKFICKISIALEVFVVIFIKENFRLDAEIINFSSLLSYISAFHIHCITSWWNWSSCVIYLLKFFNMYYMPLSWNVKHSMVHWTKNEHLTVHWAPL